MLRLLNIPPKLSDVAGETMVASRTRGKWGSGLWTADPGIRKRKSGEVSVAQR